MTLPRSACFFLDFQDTTMTTAFNRTITELDHVRIFNLLRRQPGGAVSAVDLSALIDAAELVPSQTIAADVVTMHSRLSVADPAGGQARSLTLCYPQEADAARGAISVLSPLGTALLGRRAGDVASWRGADGQESQLVVHTVDYQPEASGDYMA